MAHKIDMSNGRANMAFAGATPWHSLGQAMTELEQKNFEAALKLAGLDFDVILQNVFTQNGEVVQIPDFFAPTRTDTHAVFGVVGSKYRPIQNRDGLGLQGKLQILLDQGLGTIETAGSLSGGADVWLLVKWNLDSPIVKQVFGDKFKHYGLIVNNHSGRRVAAVVNTEVRVVCDNTRQLAASKAVLAKLGKTGDAVRVRHTKSGTDKLVEAARAVWNDIIGAIEISAKEAMILQATHLTEEELGRLVLDLIAPMPKEEPGSARGKTMAEKQQERRTEVTRLWTAGKGHQGDHSAWEALQAVTESMDHNRDLWGRGSAEMVLQSQMSGQIKTWKADVTESLLQHCVKTTEGVTMLDRIVRMDSEVSVLDRILAVN